MINILFAASVALLGGMPIETGILSQYALYDMPPVVEARQAWGQLPADLTGIDGFIATADCDRLGDTALLSINDGEWLTVMAADCSGHTSTTEWMRDNNILAEISGELAADHDVVCLCPIDGRLIWIE
jgi:hypothetical protein